jgi:DNA-directed RNA polymerase specialized sigma24 family protein
MLAKRACVDAIRQLQAAKRGGRHQPLTSDDAFTANLIDLVTGISRTPSRLAAGAEAGELLHHAIAQLPLVYQSVIKRMEIEAMPAADVAEELGRSVGAVYMIRTRAYDRLREILGSASRYFSDGA